MKKIRKIRKNELIKLSLPACEQKTASNEDERYGRAIENNVDLNLYNF